MLVLFVLQNSFSFYSTCIVFYVLFKIACFVPSLLCFVALPYSKLLFIFHHMYLKNSFHLFGFAFQIWNDYVAFGFFLVERYFFLLLCSYSDIKQLCLLPTEDLF